MVSTTVAAYPPLTEKQQLVFQVIVQFIVREGVAPTLKEIAGACQRHTITALGHLRQLERKGYVRRSVRQWRSIQVLYLPAALAVQLPAYSPALTAVIPLTRKQLQSLQFIITYWGEHGRSPSLEEIARELKVINTTVQGLIRQLEHKGCIRRTPGMYRSIEVLYQPLGGEAASRSSPVTP